MINTTAIGPTFCIFNTSEGQFMSKWVQILFLEFMPLDMKQHYRLWNILYCIITWHWTGLLIFFLKESYFGYKTLNFSYYDSFTFICLFACLFLSAFTCQVSMASLYVYGCLECTIGTSFKHDRHTEICILELLRAIGFIYQES